MTFPLAPVYRRKGITFHQAMAVAIRPEGDAEGGQPAVDIVSTRPAGPASRTGSATTT